MLLVVVVERQDDQICIVGVDDKDEDKSSAQKVKQSSRCLFKGRKSPCRREEEQGLAGVSVEKREKKEGKEEGKERMTSENKDVQMDRKGTKLSTRY